MHSWLKEADVLCFKLSHPPPPLYFCMCGINHSTVHIHYRAFHTVVVVVVRLVKNRELWACMACMALHGKNLQLAEEALAAIQEVRRGEFCGTNARFYLSAEALFLGLGNGAIVV